MPQWHKANSETFAKAAEKKLPVVLHFTKAGQVIGKNAETYGEVYERSVIGDGVGKFSKEQALFVVVFEAEDAVKAGGTQESKTEESPVFDPALPVSPWESADFFATFEAKEGQFVITDCYGYHAKTFSKAPKLTILSNEAKKQVKTITKMDKRALNGYARVAKAVEKSDLGKQVKECRRVFSLDWAGLEGVTKTIEVYKGLITTGREQMESAFEGSNLEALDELKSDFRGTILEDEIKAAMAKVVSEAERTTQGKADVEAETKK